MWKIFYILMGMDTSSEFFLESSKCDQTRLLRFQTLTVFQSASPSHLILYATACPYQLLFWKKVLSLSSFQFFYAIQSSPLINIMQSFSCDLYSSLLLFFQCVHWQLTGIRRSSDEGEVEVSPVYAAVCPHIQHRWLWLLSTVLNQYKYLCLLNTLIFFARTQRSVDAIFFLYNI